VLVGKPQDDGGGVARGHLWSVYEARYLVGGEIMVDLLLKRCLHRPGTSGYHGNTARRAGGERGGGGPGRTGGDGCRGQAAEDRVDVERHSAVLERRPVPVAHLHGYPG